MEHAGVRLKKIRLERGISLEEVQKKTKIHANILKAIEGEGLTNLSPVYLKGFLKIYCNFLGQDPKDYIPDYRHPQRPEDLSVKHIEEIRSHSFFRHAYAKAISFRPGRNLKKIIIFILIFLAAYLLLFNLGRSFGSRKTRSTKSILAQIPVTPKTKVPAAAVKTKMGAAPAQNEIRLGVQARENCFMEIKVDGRTVFKRSLEKGRFESWKAKEKIEIVTLGNAAAIDLNVNGQPFSKLGKKGQTLKNIVITREGLKIGK